jgi:hypothetical protein
VRAFTTVHIASCEGAPPALSTALISDTLDWDFAG